jgi:hypothetical protein
MSRTDCILPEPQTIFVIEVMSTEASCVLLLDRADILTIRFLEAIETAAFLKFESKNRFEDKMKRCNCCVAVYLPDPTVCICGTYISSAQTVI